MKKRIFLDPIHGNIEFDRKNQEENLILSLIETKEFQRLRRIRQLGFSYLTFYGAESTRFVHSIGACHVARSILNELENNYADLVKPHRTAILMAALLHDIGHGPFSHSSEPAFEFQHEHWTNKIILGDTEINQLLTSFNAELPEKVSNILMANTANQSWLSQIVSGQMDCDRADYLIRDSHQTGTKYGLFQLDRVIKSFELAEVNGQISLLVNEKGIQSIEDYLFARYSMYLQVYHHRKTLSADALFISVIRRARDILISGEELIASPSLIKWLSPQEESISLEDFGEVDDICILHHLKLWMKSSDTILSDLANRLLNRKLFKARRLYSLKPSLVERIKEDLGKEKAKYYCLERECKEFPYSDCRKPILVRKNGEIQELSKASTIAAALMNKDCELDLKWLFCPGEYFE